jgi:hypothetical protein
MKSVEGKVRMTREIGPIAPRVRAADWPITLGRTLISANRPDH